MPIHIREYNEFGHHAGIAGKVLHSLKRLRLAKYERIAEDQNAAYCTPYVFDCDRGFGLGELAAMARAEFEREHIRGARLACEVDGDRERGLAHEDAKLERGHPYRVERHSVRHFG